jgi:hypothetical protein
MKANRRLLWEFPLVLLLSVAVLAVQGLMAPFLRRYFQTDTVALSDCVRLRHYTQSETIWDVTSPNWIGDGQLGPGIYFYVGWSRPQIRQPMLTVDIDREDWAHLNGYVIDTPFSIAYLKTVLLFVASRLRFAQAIRYKLTESLSAYDYIECPIVGAPWAVRQIVLKRNPATTHLWARSNKWWQ